MKIEQTLLERWARIRKPGDVKAISTSLGCCNQLIYTAFRTGKCSDRVLKAVSAYYVEREKEYADLLARTEHLTVNE